jgi:hypothetical protein
MSKQLPLEDPRWVPLEVPHRLLTQRTGDRDLAAHDLTTLLATQVRSMRRYFGRDRDPRRPNLERELLPFSFWDEHKLSSWRDGLCIRHVQSSQAMPAVGLYAWEPDLQKFLPAAKTDDSMRPPSRPRGPPVTEDWFTICGEIARRCIESGRVRIPKNQTELVEDILQWCRNEHDREPAKSSVHEAVRRVCAALAKAQK